MMSTSSVFSIACLKSRLPLRQMVPRLLSISSFDIPMPLSETVSRRFFSSAVMRMAKSLRLSPTFSSVSAVYASLSMASEALEMISRRKIS